MENKYILIGVVLVVLAVVAGSMLFSISPLPSDDYTMYADFNSGTIPNMTCEQSAPILVPKIYSHLMPADCVGHCVLPGYGQLSYADLLSCNAHVVPDSFCQALGGNSGVYVTDKSSGWTYDAAEGGCMYSCTSDHMSIGAYPYEGAYLTGDNTPDTWGYGCGGLTKDVVTITGGRLNIFGNNKKMTDFKLTNLGTYDWKFDLQYGLGTPYSGNPASFEMRFNGVQIYYDVTDPGTGTLAPGKNGKLGVEITHRLLEPNVVDVYINSFLIQSFDLTGANPQIEFIRSKGSTERYNQLSVGVSIDNLRYRVPFGCTAANDEVLVQDTFSSGSKVSINTLTYKPTRFCLNNAPKIRSFSSQGMALDYKGEILQRLVGGDTLTVPDNQEWIIYYFTTNTGNLIPRCLMDEAYDTVYHNCAKAGTDVTTVQCKADADCPASPCDGITVYCDGSTQKCKYNGVCTPAVVQCHTASDCGSTNLCAGIDVNCANYRCTYTGTCNPTVVVCLKDADCPASPCEGVVGKCTLRNTCEFDGTCISKPQIETVTQTVYLVNQTTIYNHTTTTVVQYVNVTQQQPAATTGFSLKGVWDGIVRFFTILFQFAFGR